MSTSDGHSDVQSIDRHVGYFSPSIYRPQWFQSVNQSSVRQLVTVSGKRGHSLLCITM